MSNLYNSISYILRITTPIDKILINADKYYAHIPPKHSSQGLQPETLKQHIELVLEKFELLSEAHSIDLVINSLIHSVLVDYQLEHDEDVGNYIKKLFVNTVVYHDYGKINENFQASPEKMNNSFFKGKERFQSVLSTHHSALGAYLYLVKHLDEASHFSLNAKSLLSHCVLLFSYPIFKHHASKLQDEYADTIGFSIEQVNCMKEYLLNYQFDINSIYSEKIILKESTHKTFQHFANYKPSLPFELYALIRLSFSMLTTADYLASSQYMTGKREIRADFGILTNERIKKLYEFVSESDTLISGKQNFNKAIYQRLSDKYQMLNPQVQSGDNLNILRQEMAIEVVENIKANFNKNLFYIEAPTGGGKTNLSMLAVIELLKASDGKLNKVFYVFPFTTLITQTYSSIIDTLGLEDHEITQLHSKAGYKSKEEDQDGLYSDDKKNFINNLFVNYPFCLLSHIKFFDLLKSNEKEANYMLHRLANSIVVIDELQSYNPAHWDKMMYFIRYFAKHFNIKFIMMSATLPKLGNLSILKEQELGDIVYLIPNAKNQYFLNPNFSKRVTFNFDYFERKDVSLNELAISVLEKSKEYSFLEFDEAKPLNSVYTIIEFIFKKTASEFYDEIRKNHNGFFDEIFLLSGTILEYRRKYIINFLKNPINRSKRILLVTTQVVEAGVDIDMDIGFKDRSLIDSEEQLAGRINRNVNKRNCCLYLFNYNKQRIIYGQDKRYEETKKISSSEYARILKEKDFDFLYNKVLSNLQYWNDSNEFDKQNNRGLLKHYQVNIERLKFSSIHKEFKLIDKENISCFIPMEIPVYVSGEKDGTLDDVFNKSELAFLSQNNVFPNKDGKIEGSKVFDVYIDFIQNKKEYTLQKIGEKTLQGIMSKFIFSLFATEKIKQQIIHFSDEEKSDYGYKYVERWYEFYTEESGMNDQDFHSNETQFL